VAEPLPEPQSEPLPEPLPAAIAGASTPVLHASAVMAAGTLLSRVTGFVRAGMLAAAIGLATQGETFNVANTIPNGLYILIAGGVFNAVLVPQLVRAAKFDGDDGDAYANRIITLGAIVLAGVTAALMLLAPYLLRLLVDGAWFTEPELAAESESLLDFTRWCLPQIFFYGMFVLVGQILNVRGRFGPMMWAPIVNNLIAIAVVATYLVLYDDPRAGGGFTARQEVLLGLGSTVGIVAQALVLVPYLRATGFRVRPRFDFRRTGLSKTVRLGAWTVGLAVVNQVAFYVMVRIATGGVAAGETSGDTGSGYTVYSNAFLLTQVPHSIITVSLATATVPLISALAADGKLAEVAAETRRTLRLVLAVIVPFAVALVVLAPALATVLFSWGEAAGDTDVVGSTLIAFAPGLVLFSAQYVLVRAFFAVEDTRTPFLIQVVVAAVNIVTALSLTSVLEPQDVAPGLALAYGAGWAAGTVATLVILSRRLGGLGVRSVLGFTVRVVLAAVPAAALAALTLVGLTALGLEETDKLDSLVLLTACGVVGVATYLLLARLLRVHEIGQILGVLTTRLRRA